MRTYLVALTGVTIAAVWISLTPLASAGQDSRPDPQLQALIVRLQNGDLRALGPLREMGPKAAPAVPAIVAAMERAPEFASKMGRPEFASKMGRPEFAAAITRSLRADCASILGRIGPAASSAIPQLTALANSQDRIVQGTAHMALHNIKKGDTESRDFLLNALLKSDREIMHVIAAGLQNGLELEVSSDLIRRLLMHPDPDICAAAVPIAQQKPAQAKELAPALVSVYVHDIAILRHAVSDTLAIFGADALPAVIDGLTGKCAKPLETPEQKGLVRGGCIEAVERIGAAAKDAAPILVEMLKQAGNEGVIRALAAIGEAAKPAIPDLERIAATQKAESSWAHYALYRLNVDTGAHLQALVNDVGAGSNVGYRHGEDGQRGIKADDALVKIGSPAVQPLVGLIQKTPANVNTIEKTFVVLELIGADAAPALPALKQYVQSTGGSRDVDVGYLRGRAESAIFQIETKIADRDKKRNALKAGSPAR